MVVALLEWLFIPLFLFFVLTYTSSLSFNYPSIHWETIIKTYNLLELLKSKFIMDSLIKYNDFAINFVLNHLPLSFNVSVGYMYPIYVKRGYIVLPIPSNYKVIDLNGKEIFSCINKSVVAYVYRLNSTGFVCTNITNVSLVFDGYYNLLPFFKKNDKTCFYTKSKIIYVLKNVPINVSFFTNYDNFTFTTATLINITTTNLKVVFINYTGYAYVILGEGNNNVCNISSNYGTIYFPLEALNITTVSGIENKEVIPIKYRNLYILISK